MMDLSPRRLPWSPGPEDHGDGQVLQQQEHAPPERKVPGAGVHKFPRQRRLLDPPGQGWDPSLHRLYFCLVQANLYGEPDDIFTLWGVKEWQILSADSDVLQGTGRGDLFLHCQLQPSAVLQLWPTRLLPRSATSSPTSLTPSSPAHASFLVLLPPVPISLLLCPRHLVPKALVLLLEAPCSPSLLARPCPKPKVVEQTQQHLPNPLVAEGMRVKNVHNHPLLPHFASALKVLPASERLQHLKWKLTGEAGGWTEERKKQQVTQDMCPKSYRWGKIRAQKLRSGGRKQEMRSPQLSACSSATQAHPRGTCRGSAVPKRALQRPPKLATGAAVPQQGWE